MLHTVDCTDKSTNIFKKILFLFQKLTLIFRSSPLDSQRKFL